MNASARLLATATLVGAGYDLSINQTDQFELIGNQLQIKSGAEFDFEETSEIIVTVTASRQDAAPLTQDFTLTITNVTGPIFPSDLAATISENDNSFSRAITLTSINPPASLIIASGYEGPFVLSGTRLQFGAGQPGFDFEREGGTHNVPLIASDGEGETSAEFVFTIANLLPHFTTALYRDGVLVSQVANYEYQPTHDDNHDLTYSLSRDPNNASDDRQYFTINSETGAVRFVAGHVPDPALKSAYSILLTARGLVDREAFETTQIFYLNILPFPVPESQEHYGTSDNDRLLATDGDDSLFGLAGNDILVASRGGNHLDGGSGRDTASYHRASQAIAIDLSQLDTTTGELTLGQEAGREAIFDTLVSIENLRGTDFADTISGDWRDNIIEGGGGGDRVDGRSGRDSLSYQNATSAVTVDLAAPADEDGFISQPSAPLSDASSDKVRGFLNIFGSDYDDRLYGDHHDNRLEGRAGDDYLVGGGGHDTLIGGAGADRLLGGLGSDFLEGGAGADIFILEPAVTNTFDIISDFTRGVDQLQLIVPDTQVTETDINTLLSYANFSIQYSADGTGTQTAIITYGGATNSVSDDVIAMKIFKLDAQLTRDDFLLVTADDNRAAHTLKIHHVADDGIALSDSAAYDLVSFDHVTQPVTVTYTPGSSPAISSVWEANIGSQRLSLAHSEALSGSRFDDVLAGNLHANILYGRDGNDTISGNGGDDVIYGGAGNDVIRGGAGHDTLDGGQGRDQLTGGAGRDIFILNISDTSGSGGDLVTDFTRGSDLIRILTGDDFIYESHAALEDVLFDLNIGIKRRQDNDGAPQDTALYDLGTNGVLDETAQSADDRLLMLLEGVTDELSLYDFDLL